MRLCAGFAPFMLFLCLSSPAQAKNRSEYRYRFDQVWGGLVRMVRVDYGFPIRDRDPDIGYVVFDYTDGGRAVPGSAELIRFQENGESRIRVVFTVPAMPSYIERMMLDRLTKKLKEDYGEPLPSRSKSKRGRKGGADRPGNAPSKGNGSPAERDVRRGKDRDEARDRNEKQGSVSSRQR